MHAGFGICMCIYIRVLRMLVDCVVLHKPCRTHKLPSQYTNSVHNKLSTQLVWNGTEWRNSCKKAKTNLFFLFTQWLLSSSNFAYSCKTNPFLSIWILAQGAYMIYKLNRFYCEYSQRKPILCIITTYKSLTKMWQNISHTYLLKCVFKSWQRLHAQMMLHWMLDIAP